MQEETLSWLDKMKQAHAEIVARNADSWHLPLERCAEKLVMMALNALPRRLFSISWKFRSETGAQAHAGDSQKG
jgi:hypothetical protein